jgi:hypothetical protein
VGKLHLSIRGKIASINRIIHPRTFRIKSKAIIFS